MTQFLRVLKFSPSLHVECINGLWNPTTIVGVKKQKKKCLPMWKGKEKHPLDVKYLENYINYKFEKL
jgi:hypothetical protein